MRKLFYLMALAALCIWVLPGCLVTDYVGTYDMKTQGFSRVNALAEVYQYADVCDTTIPGDTFANGMTGVMYAQYELPWNPTDGYYPPVHPGFECCLGGAGCAAETEEAEKKCIKAGCCDEGGGGGGGTAGGCDGYGYECMKDLDGDGIEETPGLLLYNDIMGNHPDMYQDWYDSDGDGNPYNDSDLYCWDAIGGWWGLFTDDRPEFWAWNTPLFDNPNGASPFSWTCPGDMPPRTRDCSQRTFALTCEKDPSEIWWDTYCYSYWCYWCAPPYWRSYCYDRRYLNSNCGWAANILATEESSLDWLPGWRNSPAYPGENIGKGNRLWAVDCPEGCPDPCADNMPTDFACNYDGTGLAVCFYAMTGEIDDSICDFGIPIDKVFEAVRNASVTENGMVAMQMTGFKLGEEEVNFSEPFTLNVPPTMDNIRVPLNLQDPWLKKAASDILDSGVTSGEPVLFVNGVELAIPAIVHLNPRWLEARASTQQNIVRSR
jgi:hypothetical protein